MRPRRTDINFTSLWFGDRPFVSQSGEINFTGNFSSATTSTTVVVPSTGSDTVTYSHGLDLNPRGLGGIRLIEYVKLGPFDEPRDLANVAWEHVYSTEPGMMLPAGTNGLMRVPGSVGSKVIIQVSVNLNIRLRHNYVMDWLNFTFTRLHLKNVTKDEVVATRVHSALPNKSQYHSTVPHSLALLYTGKCDPGDLFTLILEREVWDEPEFEVYLLEEDSKSNTFDLKVVGTTG